MSKDEVNEKINLKSIVPANNLDEALDKLDLLLDYETKRVLEETPDENICITLHHSLGRQIRNDWGLWGDKSELYKWFKAKGIWHADDMSGIILTSYHRKIHNLPIKLDEQIQYYLEYWASQCNTCGGSGIAKQEEDGGVAELFCDCPAGEQKLEAFLKKNPDCRPVCKPVADPSEFTKELRKICSEEKGEKQPFIEPQIVEEACEIIDQQQRDINCVESLCNSIDEFGKPIKENQWTELGERIYEIVAEQQVENNQLGNLLRAALPNIKCENNAQSELISKIGEYLRTLTEQDNG